MRRVAERGGVRRTAESREEEEREGRRREKEKREGKQNGKEKKEKEGREGEKERDGAGFAAPTAAGRARAPVARDVRDEG